jgi:alkylated DNA repair dioxygenase AlkB
MSINAFKQFIVCDDDMLKEFCEVSDTSDKIKNVMRQWNDDTTQQEINELKKNKKLSQNEKIALQLIKDGIFSKIYNGNEKIILSKISQMDLFNKSVVSFLKKLSYDGYVLAGNSVANMIENIELQGDLDFWVMNRKDFIPAFFEIIKHLKNAKIGIYTSMLIIESDDFVPINLIYTDLEPNILIKTFDFDYCRCYWTPIFKIRATQSCIDSIFSKHIKNVVEFNNTRFSRIQKAIKYGYTFDVKFWRYHAQHLKNSDNLPPKSSVSKYSKYKIYDSEIIHRASIYNYDDKNDYVIYNNGTFEVLIKDKFDIQGTLEILQNAARYLLNLKQFNGGKISEFMNFERRHFNIIRQYIQQIILRNPLSTGDYESFQIGKHDQPNEMSEYYSGKKQRFIDKLTNLSQNEKYAIPEKISSNVSESKLDKESEDEELEDEELEYEEELDSEESDSDSEPAPTKKACSTNMCSTNMCSTKASSDISDSDSSADSNSESNSEIIDTCDNVHIQHDNYIKLKYLSQFMTDYSTKNFCEMFYYHPNKRHEIVINRANKQVFRWQQSYMNTPKCTPELISRLSYMYSGLDDSNNNNELPEIFKPYYEYAKSVDKKYNQAVICWYNDQDDYISYHSDCEKDMINMYKVMIITLNEPILNNNRTMNFTNKNNSSIIYEQIELINGSVLEIPHNVNKQFNHGIPKSIIKKGRRISISFRQINE